MAKAPLALGAVLAAVLFGLPAAAAVSIEGMSDPDISALVAYITSMK